MSAGPLAVKKAGVHDGVIESIAMQYRMDEQEIRTLYETELNKLVLGSRIKSFLPVLCTRHVKEKLLQADRVPHIN